MSEAMDDDVIAEVCMKPFVHRKHDALPTMQWLHVLRHTLGEVAEATILVNIPAEMVYHMVYSLPYRHKINAFITAC